MITHFLRPLAAAALAIVCAAPLSADVLFQENFENPDVPSYSAGITPDIWVRAAQGSGSGDHGLTDKSGGDFSAPSGNDQAYAFRYTNSGITTANGALGPPLAFGGGYQVSFDVVRDDGGAAGKPYTVQLIAFGAGATRDDCRSTPAGSTVLASTTGNAPADGSIANVSFTFIPNATTHAAEFGKDLGIRLKGATTSAIIDNVKLRAVPGAASDLNLVTTSPVDNSVNNLASKPLRVVFSNNIVAGSGNITLRNLTNSTDTVIPVGDPRIVISGVCLEIEPGSAFTWGNNYAVRIDPGAIVQNPGGTPFPGITNDTAWNFTTAGGDPLFYSISQLKSHITGVITLSAAEINTIKLNLDSVAGRFAESSASITALLDLVSTYDTSTITGRKGPLWVTTGLPKRDAVTNDLHWTIFNVMQNIMDRIYTGPILATYESLLNNFKFGSSSNFPGACAPPAANTHTATISASYLKTYGPPIIQDGPGTYARKPTGTYLAPGTIATVTVPPSMVGTGYKIRVGCHSWDFGAKPDIKRLDRVTRVYDIIASQTKIANPLGGGIYIEVPWLANAGVVTVDITGAVRSPYFSAKSFHVTTATQWETVERSNPAPWADFQTDKFMMQVPKTWISAMTGAQAIQLMADWDASMDAINDLMGYPHIRGKETMYPQVDLLLKNSVYAPGYPSVNTTYSPTGSYGGYSSSHLVRGPQNAPDYEFHEQGHGYLFPKFGGESESTVNLLHVAVWNRKFGKSMDEAFRKSRGYTRTYMTLDTTAMAWMTVFNFSPRKVPMDDSEKAYQLKGHAKFVDIANLYGWDVLGAFWKSMVDLDEANTPYTTDNDAMLLRLCKAVGKDIRPLFHFWGIYPQNPATLAASIAAAVPPILPDPAIRTRLLYYKTLVPANNAAFRTFATAWWGKQPSISGNWEEREHARQWDTAALYGAGDQQRSEATNPGEIYNENSANDITTRVQELVDLYFPGAISPNTMTFTIAPSAVNATTIGMTATTASAATGPIQYYFENTTNGTNSGWIASPTWNQSGLTTGVGYSFRAKARDGILTETNWSAALSATATAAGDVTAPAPNPLTFATPPTALGSDSITMTATTALDVNGVEYFFDCIAGGGNDSGWQDSPAYTDTGLSFGTAYSYRVQARDKSPAQNATAFSATASATTTAPDLTSPTISSVSPADGSTDVPVATELTVFFSEEIALATGSITLKNLTDATESVIDVNDGDQVVISGAELKINPTINLALGKNFAVRIDPTALQDLAGNPFAGITDDTSWNFTTVAPPPAGVVFADNFEPGVNSLGGTTPDVSTYTVANTSGQANTTLWVRASSGFNSSRNGLVDESENGGANFTDPSGTQAYGFRYTNTGLTSAAGKIGTLTAGTTITVSFDVVRDGFNAGLSYNALLVLFDAAAVRTSVEVDTNTTAAVLAKSSGAITNDASYHRFTFSYVVGSAVVDNNGATAGTSTTFLSSLLGKDIAIRFAGVTSSANIDNVQVSVTSGGGGGPGPVASFAISPITTPQTVGTPVTGLTLTAKDGSNATATSFTGTVTFGGTAGVTGPPASFVAGVLTNVSVTPTAPGSNLTLTVSDGASHTGSTTIATINPALSAYETWSGGAAFDADSNGDGVKNGMAWVLGAASPSANATGLLPTFDNSTDPDYFIYTYRRSDTAAANSSIAVQYGIDPGSWTAAVAGPNVIITPTDNFYGASPGIDKVEVRIKRTLAVGGKLFARLNVVQAP